MKTFKAVQLEQLKRIQSSQLGTWSRGDVFRTRRKPLKKWVILIALQFRYTFCMLETKRLRALKICSLQANNKVYLGQIRSEQIVYSRFIKIPLG